MENNEHSISEDTARFLQLIAMFQMAAMQQLGKLPNPVTNEVERDLQQAKASIDVLETIKSKTEGNLIEAEAEFLDKVLFELRMNYVDEANRESKKDDEDAGTAPKGGTESAGETGETAEGAGESDDSADKTDDTGETTEEPGTEKEK
jgi:hypothetical protein